jgi:hypothetical protein
LSSDTPLFDAKLLDIFHKQGVGTYPSRECTFSPTSDRSSDLEKKKKSSDFFDVESHLSDVDLNSKTGVLFVLTYYWSIRTGIARWNTAKYDLPFSDVKMSENGGIRASFLRFIASRCAVLPILEEGLRRRIVRWGVNVP